MLPAKTCYSHLGGKLGKLMLEMFIEKQWVAKNNPADKHYHVTAKGKKEFTKLGIDIGSIKEEDI